MMIPVSEAYQGDRNQKNPLPHLMEKGCHLIFLFIFFLSLPIKTRGDPRSQTVELMCGTQLEHNTTVYVPNFVATMQNISNQMQTNGFGTSRVGSGPDGNYGFAQCYGDLTPLDCALCYAEARTILPKCFPFSGGRIYLDGCFMRSENYSFYEEYRGPGDKAKCGNTTRKGSQFNQLVRQAASDATAAAPGNGGYAKAVVQGSGATNESAYVLADCWKTLNSSSCQTCLANATALVMGCLPWSEGRALNTGCFLRYSDTDFLNPEQSRGRSRGIVVAVVVAIVSAVVVLVVGMMIGIFIWKRRQIENRRKGSNEAVKMKSSLYNSRLNFKYSTLEKATGSFSAENKLGQGGFGSVYKGVLADGREIAVKRLFFNNRHRAADFYNEVNIISSVEHKNLVRLLGCNCLGPESLLVYEFLSNKSLDRFIFDPERGQILNWGIRFEIITGTAEGLVYLHENSKIRIIHRDIKASNILLDLKFRPKIADFGLARSFEEDKSHISTAIAGTLGYMAPEYLAHGQLTEKADIYSFGVLLMEIVSGKSNNRSKASDSSESIIIEAWKHFQSGTVENLIDPNLMLHNYENADAIKAEILRVVHIGLLCTQETPSFRPSISSALLMLLRREEKLPSPTRPPFTDEKTMEFHDASEDSYQSLNHPSSVATVSDSSFYPR